MIIEIYGKQGCNLCKSTKRKIEHLLSKWSLGPKVQLVFRDTDTEYGAAEADFFDVFEIPTILLKRQAEDAEVIARWDRKPPPSEELEACLRGSA